MERVILLRFSEIFLKGNNRKFFEKKLIDNIKETLKSYEYRFSTSQNRYVVSDYDVDLETEIVERLKKVFGIYSLSVANKVKTDFDEIRKAAVDLFDDTPLKFRVTVRRADKRVEIPSPVMAAEIGGDILEKTPGGLDAVIGAKGVYLSGGEMQRIALARAILKDAPIVVLDEASSFADPENEAKIQKAFEALMKGKTVLMIAHRLSTVRNMDRILVIRDGEIAEEGKHDELLEKGGVYAAMWEEYQKAAQWKVGGAA